MKKEVVERVKTLRNSSQALLRGLLPLGDCYTKGEEVRVSVGVKPKTINAAGNLAGGIADSVASQPTPTSGTMAPATAAPTPAPSGVLAPHPKVWIVIAMRNGLKTSKCASLLDPHLLEYGPYWWRPYPLWRSVILAPLWLWVSMKSWRGLPKSSSRSRRLHP